MKAKIATKTPPPGSLKRVVGVRREYEIICLAPEGFSTRRVVNIRQAMCQAEMLLETGATKIGIYAQNVEAQSNAKVRDAGGQGPASRGA